MFYADSDVCYELPEAPGIHVTEIGPFRWPVTRVNLYGSTMKVSSTPPGIGNMLGWDKATAEVAFYDSAYFPSLLLRTLTPSGSSAGAVKAGHGPQCLVYLLVRGMSSAGPDLGTHKLELLGVYPVIDGFAQLNLQQLANKGKARFSPLYVMPGGHLQCFSALHVTAIMCPVLSLLTALGGRLWLFMVAEMLCRQWKRSQEGAGAGLAAHTCTSRLRSARGRGSSL